MFSCSLVYYQLRVLIGVGIRPSDRSMTDAETRACRLVVVRIMFIMLPLGKMSLSPVTLAHCSCSFSWLLFYHGRPWLKTGPRLGLLRVFLRNYLQGIPLVLRKKNGVVSFLSHAKNSYHLSGGTPCQSGLQFAMRRITDSFGQSTDDLECS